MKTIEQALAYDFIAVGGSDRMTMALFLPAEQHGKVGLELNDTGLAEFKPLNWDEENLLEALRSSLAWGFQHALAKDLLTALDAVDDLSFILFALDTTQDPAFDTVDGIGPCGLKFFKWVASKFGLPDPLGADTGDEDKYYPSVASVMQAAIVMSGASDLKDLKDLAGLAAEAAALPPTPGCDCPACTAKLARMAAEVKPTVH